MLSDMARPPLSDPLSVCRTCRTSVRTGYCSMTDVRCNPNVVFIIEPLLFTTTSTQEYCRVLPVRSSPWSSVLITSFLLTGEQIFDNVFPITSYKEGHAIRTVHEQAVRNVRPRPCAQVSPNSTVNRWVIWPGSPIGIVTAKEDNYGIIPTLELWASSSERKGYFFRPTTAEMHQHQPTRHERTDFTKKIRFSLTTTRNTPYTSAISWLHSRVVKRLGILLAMEEVSNSWKRSMLSQELYNGWILILKRIVPVFFPDESFDVYTGWWQTKSWRVQGDDLGR